MKKYLIIFIAVLLTANVFAQNGKHLSGQVIDENKQPLPGAVVELTRQGDLLKSSTATDSRGIFVFKGLLTGNYHIHIVFLGYTALDKTLLLTKGDTLTMPVFQLLPAASALKEVIVTARRNFMTVENDKKVFYPNMLSGVASGSASDVMEQIPMVDIDKDGNITLRGKSPQVLIDGKPSPYSDISTALQMISATSIEKIEVMTNPSAKYDAEGQGGVLNIVLKKNKADGFNGVVNLDVGSYPDNHIGTDLNYRKRHLNFFGNINYHDKQVKGDQANTQHFFQRDSAAYIKQESNLNIRHKDIDSRFGVDYFINDKSTITITQGIAKRQTDISTGIYLDSGANPGLLNLAGEGNNQTHTSNMAYSTDLNFTHHFSKPGNLLTADLIRNDNSVSSAASLNNPVLFEPDQLQQDQGNSNSYSWILQTDYAGTAGKSGKIEVGFKSTVTNNKNNVTAFLYNPADSSFNYSEQLSSRFKYQEKVQALYATYADSLFGLNYKAGLRSELSNLNGDSYLQTISFNKSFLNFFPSLYLSKDIANNQTIGLSYASRISRPTFMQLLPYVNMTNPVNWQSGNLSLSPAYTQNIEFNYSKLFAKSNDFLNVSLYYTHTGNSIQMVTLDQPGGHTLTTPQNIATDKAVGSDIIYRFNIKNVVNLTTTFDLSYNKLSGANLYESNPDGFWNYRLHLEGSISLPGNFTFLAHGELTGPQILPQGYMKENKGIDVELKRQFFKKKITASAIISDVFYDRITLSNIATPTFSENDSYKENSRMVHIHLSYSF